MARHEKLFREIISLRANSKNSLSDDQIRIKELCEKSFYEFVKHYWVVTVKRPYIDNWHVGAISEHLQALYNLQIRNLIINLPPRMGKSNIISVLYPAWCWVQEPNLRFLYNSYEQKLVIRDSVNCRRLVEDKAYARLWGDKVRLTHDVKNKLVFETTAGGYRLSSTVGGANTGSGGDLVVVDDANSITKVESKVDRDNVNEWWDAVMSTRFQNPLTARRLITQQRSHTEDLSGHIINKDDPDWVILRLPMEFEKNSRCITVPLPSTPSKRWHDPRKHEGELLFPEYWPKKEVERQKKNFNNDSYLIAGQLQQRPVPMGGGIIKTDWFRKWKQKDWPEWKYIIQSWDTAMTKGDKSAYSACTTWGIFEENNINNIMLISVCKERLEYPDLRKMILRLANNYEDTVFDDKLHGYNPVDTVLIEAKGSGYSLIQDLSRMNWPNNINLVPFNPNKHAKVGGRSATDKEGRAMLITHLMENGLVWLPTEPDDYEDFTEEANIFLNACETFPSDNANDVIDSMSQALIRLTADGWLYNKEDYQPLTKEPWENPKQVYW